MPRALTPPPAPPQDVGYVAQAGVGASERTVHAEATAGLGRERALLEAVDEVEARLALVLDRSLRSSARVPHWAERVLVRRPQ